MVIRTAYSKKERHYAPSGSKDKPVMRYQYVNGEKVLQDSGQVKPVYDMIQADLEESQIMTIIKRCLGDPELIAKAGRQRLEQYLDTTEFPTTLMEAQNVLREAQAAFAALPEDMQAALQNDPDNFIRRIAERDGAQGTDNAAAKTTDRKVDG